MNTNRYTQKTNCSCTHYIHIPNYNAVFHPITGTAVPGDCLLAMYVNIRAKSMRHTYMGQHEILIAKVLTESHYQFNYGKDN